MRPPGEIRAALVDTISQAGPLTQRDAAVKAHVGYDAARRTMDNCVRSGALQIVGKEKRAHCDKWVALYDVPREPETAPDPNPAFIDLGNAIAQWR